MHQAYKNYQQYISEKRSVSLYYRKIIEILKCDYYLYNWKKIL